MEPWGRSVGLLTIFLALLLKALVTQIHCTQVLIHQQSGLAVRM